MPDINGLGAGRNEFEDCVGIAQWEVLPKGTYTVPGGTTSPYAAQTTVDLDILSEMLYFLSRGPLSSGSINFTCNNDVEDILVTVKAYYNAPEVIQHAKVCILERDDVNNGVGIFTAPHLGSSETGSSITFHISVEVPETVDDETVQLDSLLVMMPLFAIRLSDSMDIIGFRSVNFETSYAPIIIKSLLTDTGEITTSNGTIEGDFCCTESLELKTNNGPINASITLTSSDPGKPAQLSMTTSNGSITSQIALVSSAQGGTGSAFKATTQTSNGPLNITFTTAPLDSVLHFEASTSNSPVYVSLHHSYEGDFYLASGMMPPQLHVDYNARDPANRGRQRMVRTGTFSNANPGTIEGRVQWGAEDTRALGSVEITTSNGPMTVLL